ncbi:MAG: GNAT family N-acetyltransferase [Solirubrobacteraceae bacterium]
MFDDTDLMERQRRSQRAFHRALGLASPGAQLLEGDGGLQATAVPAAPRFALVNGVFYDDSAALERALPELAAFYGGAGVAHWGVWVPGPDAATARLLRARGHTRRMTPMVMGGPLRDPASDRELDLELDLDAAAALVGRCNDIAFGVRPPDTLAAAFQTDAGTGYLTYVARRGGELACGLLVRHDAGNLYTWGLAATPAARGSMVAITLMRAVVRDAVRAGCRTCTCETTPAAQTIATYMRLRPIGRWALWERRGD